MSTEAGKLDPQQLLSLLAQQRDLYSKLRELSDRQRTMISSDRPEMLLGILRERQDLVATLARLNDQLAPFRRNWDGLYASLPDDHRTRASTLLQEINGLLRVILRTDQEDGALLSARKQALAAEMTGVSDGQAANAAYARNVAAASTARADLTG